MGDAPQRSHTCREPSAGSQPPRYLQSKRTAVDKPTVILDPQSVHRITAQISEVYWVPRRSAVQGNGREGEREAGGEAGGQDEVG